MLRIVNLSTRLPTHQVTALVSILANLEIRRQDVREIWPRADAQFLQWRDSTLGLRYWHIPSLRTCDLDGEGSDALFSHQSRAVDGNGERHT